MFAVFTLLITALMAISTNCTNAIRETPFLPSLLTFENGTVVTNSIQWNERKVEISNLLQKNIVGTLPAVGNGPILKATKLINSTSYRTATSSFYELIFDTSNGGVVPTVSYYIELLVPADIEKPGCPLFLTQWNHRSWALTGLSRGYCAIVYPGSDVRDVAPDFQKAYPQASMMLIVARAYVASKTLDIFFQQQQQMTMTRSSLPTINKNQICITGHSRNGKQSLLAAAIDERFTSVVGSSPGAPIASPYHLSSHNFYGEGPDAGQAGHWWLNSTASYAAHPEKLPVDGNAVLAMIAPRRCAIANGWTDHEGDINFANEVNLASAMNVYNLLGGIDAEKNLRIIHRPGDHHGFDDVNTYFDWFDYGFGRLNGAFPLTWSGDSSLTNPFPLNYLTPAGFSWDVWYQAFGQSTPPSPTPTPDNVKERIQWLLQSEDDPVVYSKGATYGEDSRTGRFRYRSTMMGTDYENFKTDYKISRQPMSFGSYVTGNMFWSANHTKGKNDGGCPVVIWLHPYSYATGFSASYVKGGEVVADLTQAGYCVLAFDQIGMATRINEGGTNFYSRYGGTSSLFGRMVSDVISAIDTLICMSNIGKNNKTKCGTGSDYNGPYLPFPAAGTPVLSSEKITVAGYSLGGNVALHAAALDDRISSVASFSGFTPYRTDFNNKSTGGLQRLYDFHALLPRLGLFIEEKKQYQKIKNGDIWKDYSNGYDDVPYDYDEMLVSLVAPRPVLFHTPIDDRDATYQDVKSCLDDAKKKGWSEPAASFNHTTTSTYTSMGMNEITLLVDWLNSL